MGETAGRGAGTAAQYCDVDQLIFFGAHTNICGMLIIIPGNLCATRLHAVAVAVAVAMLAAASVDSCT